MVDIPWDDVRLFLAIAETGSLSAAARHLQLGQPTLSRRLALLEERLGYPVFRRSVQGTHLTPAGEKLVAPSRRMAEWAGELERAALKGDSSPQGVVRLTAPPGVAFDFLAPFAAALRDSLPNVQLQVLSTIRYMDLSRREADLALRIEPAAQRDLTTVASIELESVACASPGYKARLPASYGLDDIDWIGWAPPLEHLAPNPQLAALIDGFRPAFASDDFLVQWRAAEAGVGAMVLGQLRHRLSGPRTLERLDVDLGAHARSGLHLVCAKSALDIPRVHAVVERLLEEARARFGDDERGRMKEDMLGLEIEIRFEKAADHKRVHEIHASAFPSEDEANLVDRMRGDVSPEISLVAVTDDQLIGHVYFSPVSVGDDRRRAIALGPVAVDPAFQNREVGAKLCRRGLEACRTIGEPVVFVLGHANYYPRFGFQPAHPHGLFYKNEQFAPAFFVAELTAGALDGFEGEVRYHPAFDEG